MSIEKILSEFKPFRDNLLPILHSLQDNHPQNYLSEEALRATAKYLNMSLSSVYGVVGYYSMFSRKPRGKYVIRFCPSPVCTLMGSVNVLDWFTQFLGINVGQTTPDGLFTLEVSECLGQCMKAPFMMINHDCYGNLTPEKIETIIHQLKNG